MFSGSGDAVVVVARERALITSVGVAGTVVPAGVSADVPAGVLGRDGKADPVADGRVLTLSTRLSLLRETTAAVGVRTTCGDDDGRAPYGEDGSVALGEGGRDPIGANTAALLRASLYLLGSGGSFLPNAVRVIPSLERDAWRPEDVRVIPAAMSIPLSRGATRFPAPGPKLHLPISEPLPTVVLRLYTLGGGREYFRYAVLVSCADVKRFPVSRDLNCRPGGGPKVVPRLHARPPRQPPPRYTCGRGRS